MRQRDIRGTIANYQKAIALQPEQPAWVYHGLGDALNQNGQLEETIAAYQKAIKLKPDHPNLYLHLAQLYLEKGNLYGLIDAYQKAIRLKPNLPFPIYQKLAEALNY
ncbi:MAG: tetratricopeptide repeat protein [Xenococcaceae cyanobacterium]